MAIFTTPRSQTLRFIDKSKLNDVQNYDNRFASQLGYARTLPYEYELQLEQNDPLWCQFRTDYANITAYVVDEYDTYVDITGDLMELVTDNSGRTYYNLPIDLSNKIGCYFIEFRGSDLDKSTFIIQSEIFTVADEFEDSVIIEWRGNESYDDQMEWESHSLKQFVRVSGRDRDILPEQSKTIYDNTDFAPITLKSKPIRRVQVDIERIPAWIVEKINIGLSHDDFYVNKVQYNTEDLIEPEVLGDSQLYKAKIILTQLNFEDGEDEEITGGEILQSFIAFNDSGDRMLFNDSGDYALAN